MCAERNRPPRPPKRRDVVLMMFNEQPSKWLPTLGQIIFDQVSPGGQGTGVGGQGAGGWGQGLGSGALGAGGWGRDSGARGLGSGLRAQVSSLGA